MSNNIEISKGVAKYLMRAGRRLVSDGVGTDWHPSELAPPIDDGQGDFPGFMDELDPTSDTWMWANTLIQFARLVASIAYEAMQEDVENEDPTQEI